MIGTREINNMRLVVVESPYRGKTEEHVAYARMAIKDCLQRGESPLASHLLYTQPGILDDGIAEERKLGMEAGRAWIPQAEAMVVYMDHGLSQGMLYAIDRAKYYRIPVEFRYILKEEVS